MNKARKSSKVEGMLYADAGDVYMYTGTLGDAIKDPEAKWKVKVVHDEGLHYIALTNSVTKSVLYIMPESKI